MRRRDQVCQLQYPGCTQRIEQFDHPHNLASQGLQRAPVRSATEVQGVCTWCHDIKTKQEQAAGRARAQTQRGSLSKRYRNHDPHPGRLT